MRVHIDKYLEVARDKFQQGLAKLNAVAAEWGAAIDKLQEDPVIAEKDQEPGKEREREQQARGLELAPVLASMTEQMSHPLKKIKLE
jgi:hypothetical protein